MSPEDPQNSNKRLLNISRAVETSYRKLMPFRNLARNLVAEYAGPGYGGNTECGDKYLNMMNQAVDAYMMLLSANTPRVMVRTHKMAFGGFALHYETAANNLLKEIKFHREHYKWVLDAFFCVGVMKVHMADSGQVIAEGDILMDPGIPYASCVAIDDFVFDMSAKSIGEASFVGDMYQIPFESLKDPMYEQDIVRELTPTGHDLSGEPRTEDLSGGDEERGDSSIEDVIDLLDLYIPRDKKVYTFVVKDRGKCDIDHRPIASFDWIGTESGPYKILGFNPVPQNVMPVSPASHLESLDRLINNLTRKQANRAQRQKENPIYSPAGTADAERIREAIDGEWIASQDPNEVSVIRTGGPDPGIQGLLINGVELFDRMAGNLPMLMGLGTSADTVGQEKLIHAAGSRKAGQMQHRVLQATIEVVNELMFLLWQDEFTEIPGQINLPGHPGYSAESNWTPGDREGEWSDYGLDIDVHSLAYQSPAEQVQQVNGILGSILIPMLPALQQQGGGIDFARLTEFYAKSLNLPQLREIVVFTEPLQEAGISAGSEMGGMPPVTERRYIRTDGQSGSPSVPTAQPMQPPPTGSGQAVQPLR